MRPAIKYDSWQTYPGSYTWYTTTGAFDSRYFRSVPWKRRYMDKWASVKTTPGPKGQYRVPTTYYCEWGRWASSTSGSCYRPDSVPPGSRYRVDWDGPVGGNIGYLASNYKVPSSVENALLIRALNKLRNSQVNLGVFAAEASKTAELLTLGAGRIAKSIIDFKGRYPKEFIRAAANEGRRPAKVPRRWLELQYGWNPLLSDIYGACNVLDSGPVREKPYVAVNAKRSYTEKRTYRCIWDPGFAETEVDVDLSIDVSVRLCYKINSYLLASLSSLGLTNPAEIVWEKVPYSFVVDWFLPVGSWLSALGGDFGYSFLNGSYTRFVRTNESVGRYEPSPGFAQAYGSSVTGSAGYMYRTVYGASPWPGLYFKSPVSPSHIANSISLLATSLATRRNARF